MTVRQIIQEIEALPLEDRKEVDAYFKEQRTTISAGGAHYLARDAAQPLIREILQTHSELFQKLAK
jgi:uncharacterized protein (DUF1330 family)